MNNLHNLNVLVTRPDPQGEELCTFINRLGGHAIKFPTIGIAAAPDQEKFLRTVKVLGDQEWLIFISPQAVYASVPAIRRIWPIFPPHVNFAAVGVGTAKALHEAGYQVTAYPSAQWGSEGLLDLPEFQSISGKKIATIRGEGGRNILEKTLTSRGAQILPVIAYRRVIPKVDVSKYVLMLQEELINAIVCSSFEGVNNLKILLGPTAWPFIKSVPLVVISERIKKLAHNLDFKTVLVAQNASHKAILEILGDMVGTVST